MDAIWPPAQVSILGEWSLENGTEVMYTELYSDMRRADAATWIPDSEMIVETLNQTGFGCLELSANGLYGVKLQEGCEEQLRPSCEYTGKSLNCKCLRGLQGVSRFSLQHLWKRAVKITAKLIIGKDCGEILWLS